MNKLIPLPPKKNSQSPALARPSDSKSVQDIETDVNVEFLIKFLKKERYGDIEKYFYAYSNVKYLQLAQREQLQDDNISMALAAVKGDIAEFCRCACLQIEYILSIFIENQLKENTIIVDKDNIKILILNKTMKDTKYGRIDICNLLVKALDDEELKLIKNVMTIRDVASHRDTKGSNIKERIFNKGISLVVSSIDTQTTEDDIKEWFSNYNQVGNITYVGSKNLAYINIANKDEADRAIEELSKKNIKIKFTPNKLEEIYNNPNYYIEIHRAVIKFIKKVCHNLMNH